MHELGIDKMTALDKIRVDEVGVNCFFMTCVGRRGVIRDGGAQTTKCLNGLDSKRIIP